MPDERFGAGFGEGKAAGGVAACAVQGEGRTALIGVRIGIGIEEMGADCADVVGQGRGALRRRRHVAVDVDARSWAGAARDLCLTRSRIGLGQTDRAGRQGRGAHGDGWRGDGGVSRRLDAAAGVGGELARALDSSRSRRIANLAGLLADRRDCALGGRSLGSTLVACGGIESGRCCPALTKNQGSSRWHRWARLWRRQPGWTSRLDHESDKPFPLPVIARGFPSRPRKLIDRRPSYRTGSGRCLARLGRIDCSQPCKLTWERGWKQPARLAVPKPPGRSRSGP